MEGMRRLSIVALPLLALTACDSPKVINLGQKADGTPRQQIWLSREAKREAMAEKLALAAKGQPPPPAVGMPIQPGPSRK